MAGPWRRISSLTGLPHRAEVQTRCPQDEGGTSDPQRPVRPGMVRRGDAWRGVNGRPAASCPATPTPAPASPPRPPSTPPTMPHRLARHHTPAQGVNDAPEIDRPNLAAPLLHDLCVRCAQPADSTTRRRHLQGSANHMSRPLRHLEAEPPGSLARPVGAALSRREPDYGHYLHKPVAAGRLSTQQSYQWHQQRRQAAVDR